jgi:hypothetical protein
MKERFYEELEHVFEKFPKYRMNILLGELSAEVGREDICKCLHEISNYMKLPHRKILLSKVQCSHIVTFINLLGHLLVERSTTRLTIF